MSQTSVNKRRRRQAANGFKHLPPRKRPNYRRKLLAGIGEAIAAERRKAAREAASRSKKK